MKDRGTRTDCWTAMALAKITAGTLHQHPINSPVDLTGPLTRVIDACDGQVRGGGMLSSLGREGIWMLYQPPPPAPKGPIWNMVQTARERTMLPQINEGSGAGLSLSANPRLLSLLQRGPEPRCRAHGEHSCWASGDSSFLKE